MGEVWTLPAYPEPTADIACELEYTREYANQHYPGVPYRRLITDLDELEDVHREIGVGKRRYADAILVRGFVTQAGDIEQPTTRRGIDWERDIVLNVPTVILSDLGLATLNPTTFDVEAVLVNQGDQFRFHNMDFEVLNAKISKDRYQCTDIPVYYLLQAKVFRQDSADALTWDMDPPVGGDEVRGGA